MDISSVIIYIRQLFSTLLILLTMMSPAFGGDGVAYSAKNPDELVMSFSAVSDTHIETNNPKSYMAFNELLEGVKAGENTDAVFYLGDNVMNGQILENLFFYAGVKAVMPEEKNFVLVGNHDIGNGQGNYDLYYGNYLINNNYVLGNKIDKSYYYEVINGCYMICLASEELCVDTCIMSEEQLDWLKGVLDEATSKDAPIFVFNHHPIFSLEGVEGDALIKLLSGYKNVLYIHGHTHDPLDEESFVTEGEVSTINLPRSTETVDYEPGDGIVVEVYENEVLVRGRDFITGEWIEDLEYTYPLSK